MSKVKHVPFTWEEMLFLPQIRGIYKIWRHEIRDLKLVIDVERSDTHGRRWMAVLRHRNLPNSHLVVKSGRSRPDALYRLHKEVYTRGKLLNEAHIYMDGVYGG